MSKYKVGDVAALFPEPKEPTTESGKKLQSLFKEFHKINKNNSSQVTKKGVNTLNQEIEKTQNQRVCKNEKKRKFSAVSSPESNEVNSNKKKFKKIKKQEDTKSTEQNEKHFSFEQDFPRKKLSKSNRNKFKNNGFISLTKSETSVSDTKEEPDSNFKPKNKSNDKKQVSSFIKKSKPQRLATSNGFKSKDSQMSDEETYHNGNLFKEESGEFLAKNIKKKKKKKFSGDYSVQNTQSSNIDGDASIESDTSFKMEVADFIRNAKKKSYGKNCEMKSQPNGKNSEKKSQINISEEGTLDFIKVPGLKSEDEKDKLSRTLFVGNLPVNINKKALRTLFSPFGEIEQVRYHGIETDKAKIFSENGFQSLNANNYAADSVPGFIVFCDRESAVKATSLSGSVFKGRHITVDFALPIGVKKLYDDKRSIFIGNLPFDCQDESVWEAFSECGRIENVRIVRDKKNGIGKGFGYVQFSTVQSKENALALEDLKIQGRSVRMKTIDSNKTTPKQARNPPPVKSNTFKSRAIRIKKKNKDSTSRKSVKKIVKKQKKLHEKKKTARILQKSMKM